MTDRQLATVTPIGADAWTAERKKFVLENFAAGAPEDVADLFLKLCEKRGLSPEAKHIYLVKRGAKWVPQTSIDGQRLIAARTGTYAGSDEPVFLEGDPFPTRASVTVYRVVAGVRCPFTANAYWKEYVPPSGQDHMWKKMPHVMLAKVAESAALRKAFPEDLSGMYTDAEMDQAGPVQEASFREVPRADPHTGEIVEAVPASTTATETSETGDPSVMPHTASFTERIARAVGKEDPAERKRLLSDLFAESVNEKSSDKLAELIALSPTYEAAKAVLNTAADKYQVNAQAMIDALAARTDAPKESPAPIDQDRMLPGTMTEHQRRTMFAIQKDIDMVDDDVKRYIREQYDIDSRAKLSEAQADEVIAWLRTYQEAGR